MKSFLLKVVIECIPLLKTIPEMQHCLIVVEYVDGHKGEKINLLFKRCSMDKSLDDKHWRIQYKKFDAEDEELSDWVTLGYFKQVTDYEFIPAEASPLEYEEDE